MKELRKYESFETLSEFNEYIEKVLSLFELKTNERKLLWLLSGHSCKVLGVSWLKVQSMADALGVSYKTAQRGLKRLKELGIIKRVEQFKPVRGGHSSFLTVFCPSALTYSPEEETPEETREEATPEETETITFKANSHKNNNKDVRKNSELDPSYLENSIVPEGFRKASEPFFESAKQIYSLWRKALSVASQYAPDVLEIEKTAIQAFKQSVFAQKFNKIKGDFKGYYYGTLRNMLTVEQRKVTVSRHPLLSWNWLEE